MEQNQAQDQNKNFVAEEIFRQLNASKVNGFNFFAYTGAKSKILSTTALCMKMPANPGHVKNTVVEYNYGADTYTVIINGSEKRFEDVYADGLADLIVAEMGVK